MTNKPASPPEFDYEILAMAIGTGTNPCSFSGKIYSIYEMTEVVIKQVEKKYVAHIKNGWKTALPSLESASFDARYEKYKQFSPKHPNSITEHYKDVLKNAKQLKEKLSEIEKLKKPWKTAPTLKDSIQLYLKKDSYSHFELTSAIPSFFALQYHAWTLDCYLNGRFTLTSKKTRTERASGGGKASNGGRAELIEDILKILKSTKIEKKFKSIEDLFKTLYENILILLEDHSKNKISKKDEIPYKIPKIENMPERFRAWAAESEDFRKELDRLVQRRVTTRP